MITADDLTRDRRSWYSLDAEGKPMTRQHICARCGDVFDQTLLGERWMEICERAGPAALAAMQRDIPDLFVPVYCPACEQRDLSRWGSTAQPAQSPRPQLTDKRRFAQGMVRLEAAFNRPHEDATAEAFWTALEYVLTDDQFDRAVIGAIRSERKWPVPLTLLEYGRPRASA